MKIAKEEGIDVQSLVDAAAVQEPHIPVSIFAATQLTCFEAAILYLSDHEKYTYTTIANLTSRDPRTIWETASRARKKRSDPLPVDESGRSIPLAVLRNRKRSPLQAVVLYLFTTQHLSFARIAKILHRDPRNIWAVYQKAKTR